MVALDRVSPDYFISISKQAAKVSPAKARFQIGENVRVENLLYAVLIESANDAAFAVAEGVGGSEDGFVKLMNQKALALGLSDTRFINSTGLPGKGQYISAGDLAKIFKEALKYPLISEILKLRVNIIPSGGREVLLISSNQLLWEDESVLGGKTGYTRQAKHCFVCASERGGETVIVAVLGAPLREILWKETERLIEKGFTILTGVEEPLVYLTKDDYKSRRNRQRVK
jgi:D-alanyl-D-alanine carboxypeptidase (penicillin-binding protein 5/6)